MNEYRIKAYAKINLGLDVVRRLENGYHEVKMVMQTVGIYDVLDFKRIQNGIVITTDSGELPTNEDNLVYKAAKLMMEQYHISEGVEIHLEKHIPIAAGMAGGSTDAAATLKGMNRLSGMYVEGSDGAGREDRCGCSLLRHGRYGSGGGYRREADAACSGTGLLCAGSKTGH